VPSAVSSCSSSVLGCPGGEHACAAGVKDCNRVAEGALNPVIDNQHMCAASVGPSAENTWPDLVGGRPKWASAARPFSDVVPSCVASCLASSIGSCRVDRACAVDQCKGVVLLYWVPMIMIEPASKRLVSHSRCLSGNSA
jgi:hypothetical protein